MKGFTKSATLMTGIVLAAGAATSAFAAADQFKDWDYEPLSDDWYAQSVLDGEVYSSGGKEIGEVADFIIGDAGFIQSVIVETGGPTGDGTDFYKLPWADVDFDPNYHSINVQRTVEQINELKRKDTTAAFIGADQTSAERLIGMNVSLDGDAPFAEIENLTFTGAEQITAMLIERDGPEGEIVAVPYDSEWISESQVDLPLTLDEYNEFDTYDYDYDPIS